MRSLANSNLIWIGYILNNEKNRHDRNALRRVRGRKISEQHVEKALKFPVRSESTIKGRLNAYKTLGNRYIKMT